MFLLYIKRMDKKTILRKNAKDIRKTLDRVNISAKIRENLKKHPFYENSKNIMIFYPTKYEVNLLELMSFSDKKFFLPRVKGMELEVCEFSEESELKKSKFNILEPITNPVQPSLLDLVIVPALMVDKKGYRLGYGGGFYDRFLSENKGQFKTIVVIPQKLYVEELPIAEYDEKIDYVVTD